MSMLSPVPAADQLLRHKVYTLFLHRAPGLLSELHEFSVTDLFPLVSRQEAVLAQRQLVQVCTWRVGLSHARNPFTSVLSARPSARRLFSASHAWQVFMTRPISLTVMVRSRLIAMLLIVPATDRKSVV